MTLRNIRRDDVVEVISGCGDRVIEVVESLRIGVIRGVISGASSVSSPSPRNGAAPGIDPSLAAPCRSDRPLPRKKSPFRVSRSCGRALREQCEPNRAWGPDRGGRGIPCARRPSFRLPGRPPLPPPPAALSVIARDQHEGRVRTSTSEYRVGLLVIRPHVRSAFANLFDPALGPSQRRDHAHEAHRHRQGDPHPGVHNTTGRQEPRLGELQRPVLVAADHKGRRVSLAMLLAESTSERRNHVLGTPPTREAGEYYRLLARRPVRIGL